MNGLDAILETILAEARAEADEIVAAAQTRADAIRAQGARAADEHARAMATAAANEAVAIRARGESSAAMAGRRIMLESRRRTVTGLVDQALASLASWPEAEKVRLYADFLGQARGGETVICNAADLATGVAARAMAAAAATRAADGQPPIELTLAEQAGDFVGGLILQRGRIEDNLTFEMLTRQSREALEALAAAHVAQPTVESEK